MTCDLCDLPITEEDFECGNVVQTAFGNWHNNCINEWQDDADERRRDEEYDRSIGT